VLLQKIKNNFNSSLVSNFFSLVILQGANYLFPLLTVPYLFRILGVETFGLINFSTAFVQYFAILSDFGFNLSATKYIAANREDKDKRDKYFVNVLIAKLMLFLCGLVILLLIINFVDKFSENKAVYLLSYGSVLGSVLLPTWFFQGMEQMRYITKITIVTRTLAIIPIFFLVKSDTDFLLVPIFYGLGAIAAGLIGIYIVRVNFKLKFNFNKLSFSSVIDCLKESVDFFLSRLSLSLYTISNTFVLGMVLGNTAVGYYAAGEKLYMAVQSMYGPLNQALYPYMVKHRNILIFKKIFFAVVLINCIVIPIGIYKSEFIMHFIYSTIDFESVSILKILLGACLITVPSILLGYPFLGAFGHTRYTNLTVIISSVFHVSMLVLLVLFNSLTVYTVASLVVTTELIVLILRIRGVKKFLI
jgi:PST family polysaccharide transporter